MDTLETPPVPNGTPADTSKLTPPPADNAVSFHNPISSPAEFLHHLRSIPIGDLYSAWQQFLSRPIRVTPTEQYVETEINAWLDRMDTLMVSISIASPIY
jgi:hypothetical protein